MIVAILIQCVQLPSVCLADEKQETISILPIIEAYTRQRNLLEAADLSFVHSGTLFVDKATLWQQTQVLSFREGEERFAFKGEMRRLDHRVVPADPFEVLALPRPVVSSNMSEQQREQILVRQKVYDQISASSKYMKENLGGINQPEVMDRKSTPEFSSTIYDGKHLGRVMEGRISEIAGKKQLKQFSGAFQCRFVLFWGLYLEDPTLSESDIVLRSQRVASLPELMNDKRITARRITENSKMMVVLEGEAGLESVKGLVKEIRCWLDPDRDYVITRSDYIDMDTHALNSRLEFEDYRQYENGLWLPHRITYTQFGLPSGAKEFLGKPLVSDVLNVTDVSLNDSVSDDVFAINIPLGGKVFDFEKGRDGQPVEYVWGGPRQRQFESSNRNRILVILVVANVILAIGFITFWLYRRWCHSAN